VDRGVHRHQKEDRLYLPDPMRADPASIQTGLKNEKGNQDE